MVDRHERRGACLQFGVLGPLELTRDGAPIHLGSPKQRSVLGILLAHAGRVVSSDELVEGIWGEDGSTDHLNALWVHVSNLRKALEPDTHKRSAGGVIQTRHPGYVLETTGHEVDASAFELLVAEGRALVELDPVAAADRFSEALALWRGRAYADFTYESWAQPEISRLEELRLEAVEGRIEAEQRMGLAQELIGELQSLVREHPTRERLTASLMLALYRTGRQAEALRCYEALRGRLADELGIEPAGMLRRLEEQIVTNDPALEHATPLRSGGSRRGLSVRGYEVRERLGDRESSVVYRGFHPAVGREVTIEIIRAELADDPDFIQRFEAEAQVVARLEHPHIVPLYDYWREPGAAYLIMRYVRGGTLGDRIAEGPLGSDELAALVDQVGAALETVARSGVRHGSVQPDKILLDDHGNFYLAAIDIAAGPAARVGETDDVCGLAASVAQAAAGRMDSPSDLLDEIDVLLSAALRPLVEPADGAGHVDPGEFRRSVLEVIHPDRTPAAPVIDENPYKGLRCFEQGDAQDFFGRERFVDRLVTRLGRVGVAGRFIAVVGASGSGKSSAVKAGLIPAVRAGAVPGSDGWFTIDMTPGVHPFEQLEAALLAVAIDPPTSLLGQLTADRGILRAIEEVLPPGDAPLLIVVDQFEELFTQSDPDEAIRFLDALVAAILSEHSRVRVVVTLRADFYDRPLRHQAFGELLATGTEVLTPMSAEELQRAISGPAERVGAVCEPALVGDLVAAVIDQPAALPLLEYTLTELFARREGNVLTASAYRELGGVAGALVERAEGVLMGLSAEDRHAARSILLHLVTVGDEGEATRRRVPLSELITVAARPQSTMRIVDAFARHRLLALNRDPVTRSPTVEISHETVLTEWGRLARWIDEARSDIQAERRLSEATHEWLDSDRDPAFTLVDARLARYAGWSTQAPLGLTAGEREFLAASENAERDQQAERDEQEHRDVLLRRRSRFLLGLALVSAVIVALGLFAFVEQRRASDLADELERSGEARRIAAEAQLQTSADPELALMLAIEAARATAPAGVVMPEAMDALHAGLQATQVPYPVRDAPVAVRASGGGGVFMLSPDDLVGLAQDQVRRPFTQLECEATGLDPCHDPASPLPNGLVIDGGEEAYAGIASATPLAGTEVLIVGPETDEVLAAFQKSFEPLFEQTGIEVTVRTQRGDEHAISVIEDPSNEDIVILPQLGALEGVATDHLIDVSAYIDRESLEERWSPYLTDLVSVSEDGTWPSGEGPIYGVWRMLDAKSLFWYSPSVLGASDHAVPSSWDELIELADTLVAAGETPFCVGLAGMGGGWPATDTLEAILLASEGPDFYDAWVLHEVPFDHPAVLEAARSLGDLVFTPGYLPGSAAGATLQPFFEAVIGLSDDPPRCWMVQLASFAPAVSGAPAGELIDAFPFPVVDPAYADAMVGGGTIAVALTDRPEVRTVMEFIASPEFGVATAEAGIGWIPAHTGFDLSKIANDTERRIAEVTHAAVAADRFRFDGSDLMPGRIGTIAFWGGMTDWFREGPDSLDTVMADIEARWVELEQQQLE